MGHANTSHDGHRPADRSADSDGGFVLTDTPAPDLRSHRTVALATSPSTTSVSVPTYCPRPPIRKTATHTATQDALADAVRLKHGRERNLLLRYLANYTSPATCYETPAHPDFHLYPTICPADLADG